MHSLARRPRSPLLAPFVASFHYHEGNIPEALERIVPTGQAHLMVNLAEDEFRTYGGMDCRTVSRTGGAVLAGPHGRSTVIDTREQCWLLAVEFEVGGAAQFITVPISETCDQVVDLEHLWGRDGAVLRERLAEAGTPEAKFGIFETVLLEHLVQSQDLVISSAVSVLESGVTVAEAGSRLGLLPKTFVRRFRKQVGLAPKRFARVRRLQRIVASAFDPLGVDWSMLAAEHGYTDQAHFIHDFRDLTGITPTAYQPYSPQRRNHIHIAAPGR